MNYSHWDALDGHGPGADDEALETQRLDADLEMAELARAGNAIHAARKAGHCPHASAVGYRHPPAYPEQEGLRPGQLRCTDGDPAEPGGLRGCGAVFDSDDDWYAAMADAVAGY